MKDSEYNKLHVLSKQLNKNRISCAANGTQEKFEGHSTFNKNEKFTIIQNRKGKRRKDNLTYVLLHNSSQIMIRIDINGASHQKVPTPHVHIFDDKHNQGLTAIPLKELKDYDSTDDIINSLIEFIKYNNFNLNDIHFDEKIV